MGAPGSDYWKGSLFVYNITRNKYKAFLDDDNRVEFGSYLGTKKIDTQIIMFLTETSNYK